MVPSEAAALGSLVAARDGTIRRTRGAQALPLSLLHGTRHDRWRGDAFVTAWDICLAELTRTGGWFDLGVVSDSGSSNHPDAEG